MTRKTEEGAEAVFQGFGRPYKQIVEEGAH